MWTVPNGVGPEDVVVSTRGAVTPHVTTVTTEQGVAYTVSRYVAVADNPSVKRVTVVAVGPGAGSRGRGCRARWWPTVVAGYRCRTSPSPGDRGESPPSTQATRPYCRSSSTTWAPGTPSSATVHRRRVRRQRDALPGPGLRRQLRSTQPSRAGRRHRRSLHHGGVAARLHHVLPGRAHLPDRRHLRGRAHRRFRQPARCARIVGHHRQPRRAGVRRRRLPHGQPDAHPDPDPDHGHSDADSNAPTPTPTPTTPTPTPTPTVSCPQPSPTPTSPAGFTLHRYLLQTGPWARPAPRTSTPWVWTIARFRAVTAISRRPAPESVG